MSVGREIQWLEEEIDGQSIERKQSRQSVTVTTNDNSLDLTKMSFETLLTTPICDEDGLKPEYHKGSERRAPVQLAHDIGQDHHLLEELKRLSDNPLTPQDLRYGHRKNFQGSEPNPRGTKPRKPNAYDGSEVVYDKHNGKLDLTCIRKNASPYDTK